jgi:hypothetical protein
MMAWQRQVTTASLFQGFYYRFSLLGPLFLGSRIPPVDLKVISVLKMYHTPTLQI